MTKDMNQDIKLGQMLNKMYEKGIVIAIIGAIACFAMVAISLVKYDGVVAPIIWLIALLVNANAIFTCVRIKKAKAAKNATE